MLEGLEGVELTWSPPEDRAGLPRRSGFRRKFERSICHRSTGLARSPENNRSESLGAQENCPMGLITEFLDAGRKLGLWLVSKQNRLRLSGNRIEVICFLLARRPQWEVLLGKSSFADIWMPPQEGLNIGEAFDQAIYRCLSVECGFALPADASALERLINVRSIKFLGTVPLAADRQGERLVADNALGTALEGVHLRSKAYWKAAIAISHRDNVRPSPDGNELTELKWFSLSDAERIIVESNHEAKQQLLLRGLQEIRNEFRIPSDERAS